MENNNIITVFEDTMSKVHMVMAAIMYTFAVSPFLAYIYFIVEYDLNAVIVIKFLAYAISLSAPFIGPAINISEENTVKVDAKNKTLITEQKIVFYQKTKITEVTDFDYVAINSFGFGYTVTLWYQNNGYRHIPLVSFYKKNKAFLYAKSLCKVIDVDLLDKIDTNNPVWIYRSEL
ncbi:hypothetical protein [Flavobacterium sp. GCM10023249]|uniref:hypothetical protein n=1 Tax=unclassified Flavobacterium TaxID=196869 RepID=UPI00361D6369